MSRSTASSRCGPSRPAAAPCGAISDLPLLRPSYLALPHPFGCPHAPASPPTPARWPLHQVPAAAPLPLGPSGLRLKLDCGSVMAAWQAQAQVHPFQLRGPALQAAVAALPSTADLEASLQAASQQCVGGQQAQPSAASLAAAEARRKLEAQRQRDRKAAARKSDRKVRLCFQLWREHKPGSRLQGRGASGGQQGWAPCARTTAGAVRYGPPPEGRLAACCAHPAARQRWLPAAHWTLLTHASPLSCPPPRWSTPPARPPLTSGRASRAAL